jgi:hypothetical protein
MAAQQYPYRPLDPTKEEFRRLDMQSGPGEEPIRASIRHESMAEGLRPPYNTISYAWGNPARTSCIYLDDKPLYVPVNTEAALRRNRRLHTLGIVNLWIDAICINQDNIQERGEQVAMMNEIYGRSDGNLVYFGGIRW